MKKATFIEVQVVVPVIDDIAEKVASVTSAALAFKAELGEVAQFNILTRELPVQEQ